jgi:hypothetical protein
MRRYTATRWLTLLASTGIVFSSGSTCTLRQWFDSLLGSFVSPGTGGLDTDGDGFTDAQELQGGSDSFDPSSTPNNP